MRRAPENLRQRPTTAQRLEEHIGPGLAERALRLFPNALGDECIDFARGRHALHQDESVFGYPETQVGISSGKTSDAQDAHRVLHERVRHVTQHTRLQVTAPSIGIDDFARRRLCHRIDGEIAAAQIVLESHVGGKLRRKTPIPEPHFALEAGKRVFLVRFRMQKDGEFAPNRLVAVTLEFLGTSAHDDPVALVHRAPEQAIPNRAANQVDFHTYRAIPERRRAQRAPVLLYPRKSRIWYSPVSVSTSTSAKLATNDMVVPSRGKLSLATPIRP